MSYQIELESVKKCPMCKKIVSKLVPLYDHDQNHTKQQCCKKCKKCLRTGKEIKKFTRDEEIIRKMEDEALVKIRGN